MEEEGRKILLQLIEKYHGRKILEVGCGNDKLISILSKKFDAIIKCVDPYGYGKNIIRMKGEEVSKLNEKFDVVYTLMSLHHMEASLFLKEASKVLNDDGKIIIVDWKHGTYTGVPEYYFSLGEVIEMMKDYEIIEKGITRYHFYVVGKKSRSKNS